MTIIKVLVEDNYLPDNIVLGYTGENRTTELQLHVDNIVQGATYTLELSNKEDIRLEEQDGFLMAEIPAEVLTTGEVDAQLVWSWTASQRGQEAYVATDKTNVAHWKVLDSVSLSKEYEKEYPEILQQILVDINDIKENGGGTGKPGFSPIVELEETEEGVAITVTDVEGEKAALIQNGEDGFSPEIIVDEVEGGYQLTITNKDTDPTVAILYHGEKGKDGKDGQNGKDGLDGKDGQDGFSPTIEAEAVENGYQMTITNKDAEPTVVVLYHGEKGKDGKDGQNGTDGKDGQNGKDGENGKDYVITDADYQAIAEYVLTIMEDGDTLKY